MLQLRPARRFLSVLRLASLALLASGCIVLDAPMLGLRSIAGGIHNRRQVSGLDVLFLEDGRMALAANGALLVEREPGGLRVRVCDQFAEVDDVDPSPDGTRVVFVSGRDQITAGGAHKDHVFQVYALELATGAWTRLGTSRRAELLPHFTADGARIVFARRAEYEGWSLHNPWGDASLFVMDADGGNERRLTGPLAYPLLGLDLVGEDSLILYGARGEDGVPNVYAVDYPDGGEPRLFVPRAFLPTGLPASERRGGAAFMVVRPGEHGTYLLAACSSDGSVLAEEPLSEHEPLSLAVEPGGRAVYWTEFDPEDDRFGRYRLLKRPRGSDLSVELETLAYRNPVRYKPLDVIRPPSWWFHSGSSPGSR